jgi:transcriptional regulator with XRE-family HTH domain
MQRIAAHVTLRSLREARGLTAIQLAERLRERGVKIDHNHIYSVELGFKRAGNPLRVAWAAELGVNPRDIAFAAEIREMVAAADADDAAAEPKSGAAA